MFYNEHTVESWGLGYSMEEKKANSLWSGAQEGMSAEDREREPNH